MSLYIQYEASFRPTSSVEDGKWHYTHAKSPSLDRSETLGTIVTVSHYRQTDIPRIEQTFDPPEITGQRVQICKG